MAKKQVDTTASSLVETEDHHEEYEVKEYIQNITINMNNENQNVIIRQYGVPNNPPPNTGP